MFTTAGYNQLGFNNEDQFRLSAGTTGVQTLKISGPTNTVIPVVAVATNVTGLNFGGALPLDPITATVIYATPGGNPDDACNLAGNAGLAGKIALLDRGGDGCDSVTKAEQAQTAGALAVIMITPGDTGFPFRLDGTSTNIHIPVLVIAENYGGSQLKSYLQNNTPVTATIQGDPAPRLAEWNGGKGFGAVDVTARIAVPSAGIYPLRLVSGQESGTANLEWFSYKSDGTKVLLNDPNDSAALKTFRARTAVTAPLKFGAPVVTAQGVTIAWTGNGTLQEAASVSGPWTDSTSQANPQTVPATGAKFYRLKQ